MPPMPLREARVGRGYTAEFRVQIRDHRSRPVVGTFSGSESLTLVICDGAGAALPLVGSGVEWRALLDDGTTVVGADAAALGLCTVKADDSDTVGFAPGRYPMSVSVMRGAEPVEILRAVLVIEARPTTDAP